jgi:peptide-methionine (S)-S-oxide reductase
VSAGKTSSLYFSNLGKKQQILKMTNDDNTKTNTSRGECHSIRRYRLSPVVRFYCKMGLARIATATAAVLITTCTRHVESLAVPVVPEFYSKILSPLAQTAASYSAKGQMVPPFLNSRDYKTGDSGIDGASVATFAGGCMWGIELAYQREPGVLATCVGYTQGDTEYPTYTNVCSEESGHTEACLVVFDPTQVTYPKLSNLLFDRIPDPTMLNRVGRDRGTQYRTGMYAHSADQLVQAQTAFDRENRTWMTSGRPVVTEVAPAQAFWPAEEEHQRYLEKGGRFGRPQSTEKGDPEEIRCYG